MNKQRIINKAVELYEKAEHNIKNADKPTLWIVIGLLTLALMFKSTNNQPNITINMPETTVSGVIPASIVQPAKITVTNDSGTNLKKTAPIKSVSSKSSNTHTEVEIPTIVPNGKFKYCLVQSSSEPNDPFAKKEDNRITFVLEEAINSKGETYVKTSIFSDTEDYVDTNNLSWYRYAKKVPCTDEMIANSTTESYRKRFYK